MKKLNRQVLYMEEQETPPKVNLKPASIDFGEAGYSQSMTKTLEVKNTGKVSAEFQTYGPSDWVFTHVRTLDTLRLLVRAC